MREWLTVIVVLLIVGILLDGFRRMRNSRRDAVRMPLSMHSGASKEDLEGYGSELPSGGARVSERCENSVQHLNHSLSQAINRDQLFKFKPVYDASQKPDAEPQKTPTASTETASIEETTAVDSSPELAAVEASSLEAAGEASEQEQVVPPVSVELTADAAPAEESLAIEQTEIVEQPVESSAVGLNRVDSSNAEPVVPREPEQVTLNLEEAVPMLMDVEQGSAAADNAVLDTVADERIEPTLAAGGAAIVDESPVAEPEVTTAAAKPSVADSQMQEVLVMNVVAKPGQELDGSRLLDVVLACGLRYGSMQIFHRHSEDNGEGPVQFSMVNMVQPGTFNLNKMRNFTTPGVSLFMTLPMEANSIEAYDAMAGTAKAIADNLGGLLKDENHSIMMAQTVEHGRQRVREFERKQLSRTPA